jgi:SAM-dependent methyltransferase
MSSWACPWCGVAVDATAPGGTRACTGCGRGFQFDGNVLSWAAPPEASGPQKRNLLTLALRQFNPLSSRLSPLRYFSDWRVERYYRRTVSDPALARLWCDHYLAGLSLPRGAAILDYGCGRGRHVGLLTQLGFRMAAQDLQPRSWWTHFPDCAFQALPAAAPRLPWASRAFRAVLDINVVHHLDDFQLQALAAEVFRVVEPGGVWILLEANAESYGAFLPMKYYGRLHCLEHVAQIAADAGFRELDRSFEGVYAPLLPNLVNFVRKQAWPGPFMIEDFDSKLAAKLPPSRRAQWLLRVQKPASHD